MAGVDPKELRGALLGLAGSVTAADDQARAMTDAELAERLLTGRWTTIEVHEAGRRLMAAHKEPAGRSLPEALPDGPPTEGA